MKKWFTDLDESVRVKLMEWHKQTELIEYGREISDDQAFEDLKETAWSEDGTSIATDIEVKYLQIVDDSNVIIDRINNEYSKDMAMAFEIRQLLIKINHLENTIKIWKS